MTETEKSPQVRNHGNKKRVRVSKLESEKQSMKGGVDQGAVEGDLRAVLLGGVLLAVPVGGVLAVVAPTVAGGGKKNLGVVGLEGIGAARKPAEIDGAGCHGLAGSLK